MRQPCITTWRAGSGPRLLRISSGRSSSQVVVDDVASIDWNAVDERLDAGARRQELRVALAALTEAEREVLLLVAWEGLTPTEAAEALGLTPVAARSRLHRARTRAQAALAEMTCAGL